MTDSSSKDFKIHYRKKKKLNPKVNPSKESDKEVIIITEETPPSTQRSDKGTSTTPTTSTISKNQPTSTYQDQKKAIHTSTTTTEEKEKTVFYTFKEIKMKNEMLKTSTYNQFWKQTPNSQSRLLSTFDSENGKNAS